MSRRQLLEYGFSSEAIDHRIRCGRLHPVRRGVYAVGRAELSRHGQRMAAVLAAGPSAVLSHSSAAELWGIVAPLSAPLSASPSGPCRYEITVPGHRKPRPAGIRIHRRSLAAGDLGTCAGIPVTAPVRTLLDLAGVCGDMRLEAAIVAADKLDLVDAESLRSSLEDLGGEYGTSALRRVLDRRTFAITDSELERRFLRLVIKTGLPAPEVGARLHGFKLDFLWRSLGLVVETDGLRYHRTPAQQARDRRRDQVLAAAGLTVLRFTHGQVFHNPAEVERTLRSVASRLATLRRSSARSR